MPSIDPYYDENAISQQYRLADALREQPQARSWAGVIAQGLGGLGSGLMRNAAQGALQSNQTRRADTLGQAMQAGDNATMAKILSGSGIPEFGEKALGVTISDRKEAADRAWQTQNAAANREAQARLQRENFEFQKRLTVDLEREKRQSQMDLIKSILGPDAIGGGGVAQQPTAPGPATPQLDPNSSDEAFVGELTTAPPVAGVEANKRAAVALALGDNGGFMRALEDKAKPTEQQTKDASFAERMLRAEMDMRQVAPINQKGEFTKYNPAATINKFIPDANIWDSSNYQQVNRAAREGIAAILRKDTGAAVTDTEWDWYFPMYYPQPGDGPQVILDKQRARLAVARGLRGSAGPAFERMFPNFNQQLRARLQAQGADLSPRQTSKRDGSSQSFDSEADIPEGAKVKDEAGNLFVKRGGALVPVQKNDLLPNDNPGSMGAGPGYAPWGG